MTQYPRRSTGPGSAGWEIDNEEGDGVTPEQLREIRAAQTARDTSIALMTSAGYTHDQIIAHLPPAASSPSRRS
jgi:hypothetical protein